MAEDKQETEQKKDDLDLLILAEKIILFWRKYGSIMIGSSIAGILLGIAVFFISPKRYGSSMLLHSFTLTNTEHINIIENWDELLKKAEYESLSSDLGCDPALLKKVSKISALEIQKLYIQNNPNGFMVEVIVSDTAILDALQKAIIHGLESSEYMKEKLETKKSNLTQLITKATDEIIKLDSLKQSIENSINNRHGSNSASFIIDISNITGQMMNLNEKLLGYREELKFAQAVQVLHNFSKFKNPVSPNLFKLVVLGLLGGFAIGYIISMYKYMNNRIKRRNTF